MGRKAGPPTRMVRVTTSVGDRLAARAKAAGVTIGEYVAVLLATAEIEASPRPATPTVNLLVDERTLRPAAPPASSQATGMGGPRCRCKSPTMSKVVTNICTACGLIRRP